MSFGAFPKTGAADFPAHDRRPPIEIVAIGIRAQKLSQDSIRPGVGGIILAGFGGALDRKLVVGDVIVESPVGVTLNGDPDEKLRFLHGKVTDSDRIIATVAEKQRLFQQTGAAVVDMESGPVRALAGRLGVPLIIVRAVSDAASDAVHPATLGMIDEFGQPRPARLATGLLRRPNLLTHLVGLGLRTRLASRRLGETVRWICQQPTEQWWQTKTAD